MHLPAGSKNGGLTTFAPVTLPASCTVTSAPTGAAADLRKTSASAMLSASEPRRTRRRSTQPSVASPSVKRQMAADDEVGVTHESDELQTIGSHVLRKQERALADEVAGFGGGDLTPTDIVWHGRAVRVGAYVQVPFLETKRRRRLNPAIRQARRFDPRQAAPTRSRHCACGHVDFVCGLAAEAHTVNARAHTHSRFAMRMAR